MSFAPFTPLAPGAPVAVVAPAGPLPAELYRRGLELLEQRYTLARVHRSGPAPLPYLAAEDRARADEVRAALDDGSIAGIFCARGGYGTVRLLASLDRAALARRRIPIVGFSDVTALHAWAFARGISTVHGPVVTQLSRLPLEDLAALWALLEGRDPPRLEGLVTLVAGRARGRLIAANLALLASLCGTPYAPPLDGCLLVLEDVGEAPYRIDRMLTQLLLAGQLDRVAGVVLGELVDCGDPDLAERVFLERLRPLAIPLAAGAPVGHGARNVALPLGALAELDATTGTLELEPG